MPVLKRRDLMALNATQTIQIESNSLCPMIEKSAKDRCLSNPNRSK